MVASPPPTAPVERLRGPDAQEAADQVERMADALHPDFAALAGALRDAAALARGAAAGQPGAAAALEALLAELSGPEVAEALADSRARFQADRTREQLEEAAAGAIPGPLVGLVFEQIHVVGDAGELEAMLESELARAEMTLLSYEDGLLLEPAQWTAAAAVADEALSAGLLAWIEALEDMLRHSRRGDLEGADRALCGLEEADRRLAAVASLSPHGKGCPT